MKLPELQRWLQLTLAWRLDASRLKLLRTQLVTLDDLLSLTHAAYCAMGMPEQTWSFFAGWQHGIVDPAVARTVEQSLEWLSQPCTAVIPIGDDHYPPLLATCADAPPQLFVRGDPALLSLPQIAIVGSRKPSVDGRRHAQRFASALVQCGYQITSGLALGIDTESHRGALSSKGNTIAVLGSGLASIYPPGNVALAEEITEQGALVSEFPPHTQAESWHFPERNRIISGLSHGVLVVEAAEKSGSLITARLAAEQGREVFAIPGSINNPLARGCHRLIRQGAKLVESVEEIIEELPALVAWEQGSAHQSSSDLSSKGRLSRKRQPKLSMVAKTLLQYIGYDPVSLDSLLLRSDLPVTEALPALTELELHGIVAMHEHSYVLSAHS